MGSPENKNILDGASNTSQLQNNESINLANTNDKEKLFGVIEKFNIISKSSQNEKVSNNSDEFKVIDVIGNNESINEVNEIINKRNQEKDIVINEEISKGDNFLSKVNRKSSSKIGEFTNIVFTSNDEKLPYMSSELNDNNAIYHKKKILNITNKLKIFDEIDNNKSPSVIDDFSNEESKEKNYLNNEVIAQVNDVLLKEVNSSSPVKIEESVNIVKTYADDKISPNNKILNLLNESKVLDNEGSQSKNHVNNESILKFRNFSKVVDNPFPLTHDESVFKINEEKLSIIKEKTNDDNEIFQHEKNFNISNVFKDLDAIDNNKCVNTIDNKFTVENTSLNDKIVVKDSILSLEQTVDKNDELVEEETEIIEEIEFIVEEIIEVEDRVENQNNLSVNKIVNTKDDKNNELKKVESLDLMKSVSSNEIHQLQKDILIKKEFSNDDEYTINPKQLKCLKVYANKRKFQTHVNHDKNTEKCNIDTKNYNESKCNSESGHSLNLNLDAEDTSANFTLSEEIFEFSEVNNFAEIEEDSIKCYDEKVLNNYECEEQINTIVDRNKQKDQKYIQNTSEIFFDKNSQFSNYVKEEPAKDITMLKPVTELCKRNNTEPKLLNVSNEFAHKNCDIFDVSNKNKVSDKAKKSTNFMQIIKSPFTNQEYEIENDQNYDVINDQFENFKDPKLKEEIRDLNSIKTSANITEPTGKNNKFERKNYVEKMNISDLHQEGKRSEMNKIVNNKCRILRARNRSISILNSVYKEIETPSIRTRSKSLNFNKEQGIININFEDSDNKQYRKKDEKPKETEKEKINNYAEIEESSFNNNSQISDCIKEVPVKVTKIPDQVKGLYESNNIKEKKVFNEPQVLNIINEQHTKTIFENETAINTNDESCCEPNDCFQSFQDPSTEGKIGNVNNINTSEDSNELAENNKKSKGKNNHITMTQISDMDKEINRSENIEITQGTVPEKKRRGRPPKKRKKIINENDQSTSMPAENATEIATENTIENALEIATENTAENTTNIATENTIENALEIATENTAENTTDIATEIYTENKDLSIKEDNFDTSITPKKRRGRPPKNSIVLKNTETEIEIFDNDSDVSIKEDNFDTTIIPKKRRGRPPKNSIVLKNKETKIEIFDHDSDVSVKEDNFDEPIIPKKRRGRPPKNSIVLKAKETKVEISDDDLVPLAIRSRKRKRSSVSSIDRESKRRRLSRYSLNKDSDSDKESKERLSNESNNEIDGGETDDRPLKKRVRHFNLYKGRKRGRPKGGGRKRNDDDYVPHHSQIKKDTKTDTIRIRRPSEPCVKKMVTCGKCDKEMLKTQWAHHNLSVHNDLGWLSNSEKPDFDNDEKLVKRVLFNAIKRRKGGLICETCHVVKRSVLGFLSHVTFCGKDEEEKQALMVTCPVCKAITKPSSLEYHERLHKMQAEENQRISLEELENDGPKGKRKAAEKALSKITEFMAVVKEDKDNNLLLDTKLKLKSSSVKKLIKKPQLKKRFPNTTLIKWTKDLDSGKDAMCNQPGCEFTSKSLDEIKQHYSMCNFTPQKNFVCKICKFQSLSENEIVKHALQKHSTEDNDDTNLSISDAESSSSGNLSEVDEISRENRKDGLFKKFFLKESTDNSNKMFKFLFKDGACHTKYNKPFFGAFQWTLEFEENNYDFNLFEEYMPNSFKLLNEHESITYLPELKESMSMKSVKTGTRDFTESDWKKWKLFEGNCIEDNPTFFVGGPVWALAWLPIPTSLAFSENVQQYIAISTHSTMDVQYSIGQNYSGKNIIQIWKLGDLDHKTNSKQDPELAYAIAHDGGTVWCLDWCPSGCYQHGDMSNFINENNEPRRMGLLAAACSDGCIRVYSLIFPDDLPSLSINEDTMKNSRKNYPIYNTEPVLMLVVNKEMYYNKQQTWQVTKLSWSKENKHSVVVAGFSNGYVALWDLTSKSPMVKSKNGNTVFLNPYRHFMAHYHAITMVHLIPQDNKRFLATASLDRYYKFWDLEDVTYPRNTYKKSFVTDGTWLNHWCCALLAYDEGLSMTHNYAYCLPLREYTYKYYNVLPTNSTSYAISASDYGNSIATGTLAGEVLAMFPQQLLYVRDMDKILPRKRFISMISSTEVVDFQATESNKNADNKNDKEYQYKPSSYSDSKDRFGIKFTDRMSQFRDENTTRKNYKKTLTCEMMQSVPIEQYSFMSANRVAWNPNAWSFLWLAVGYQSGFVRLISFKSLAAANEWNKLLESHINNLKCKSTISEEARNDGS